MSRGTDTPVAYEAPRVVDYGTLTDVTAANTTGEFLDADFPAGTPKGDLTFSG